MGRGGKRRVRRRAGDNAPAGRSAGPVSGRISGVGASGRGIHDPLHGHVHGADRHPLQPLWSQHMSADSALRRRRLRHRFGRKLPDGIRRLDAAGARRQELLPLLLQRLRFRCHFPRLPLSGIAAAGLCPCNAAGADPSAGDTAFQTYVPRSRRRRRRSDTARADRLLRQLGRGRRIHGSGHGTGRRGRIGRSAMDFHGPSAPVARHALHHCSTRPDGALFLSFGHLCRRNQAAFHPYL